MFVEWLIIIVGVDVKLHVLSYLWVINRMFIGFSRIQLDVSTMDID